MKLKYTLDDGAFAPIRAHEYDAGLDIKSPVNIKIPPRGSAIIDTGLHVEILPGMVGMLKSKSGLNVHHGITSEGVIDSGYTGSIKVKMYNNGEFGFPVHRGDKISQLVILPCILPELELVKELQDTERGTGGFGSTGR